jgi:hypothetical protein
MKTIGMKNIKLGSGSNLETMIFNSYWCINPRPPRLDSRHCTPQGRLRCLAQVIIAPSHANDATCAPMEQRLRGTLRKGILASVFSRTSRGRHGLLSRHQRVMCPSARLRQCCSLTARGGSAPASLSPRGRRPWQT